MRRSLIVWLILAALLLAACAAGDNPATGTPADDGSVAGFWLGLWHGIITPITFIISLFNSDVGIYEIHNSGNWYNFGYVLGVGTLLGGGGSTTCRAMK